MKRKLLSCAACLLSLLIPLHSNAQRSDAVNISIQPDGKRLMTTTIQAAIDSCAAAGGGQVILEKGLFISGSIFLKNKVRLILNDSCLLQGSTRISDYVTDGLINGDYLFDIEISGKGSIDGRDCFNPQGEEGFRGPHLIRLTECKGIVLKDFTLCNAGNYAIRCRDCKNADIQNIRIKGGHDGLHTRFCSNFTVRNCDFRTGDDAFAGNDNNDFAISGCMINTSCNAFRLGCFNLNVSDCKIWGPGESIHKIQKRNNLLSVFVHFSPDDENTRIKSGNWHIRNLVVENADHFFMYNFRDGLWQTGQPLTNVYMDSIYATGLLSAFNIIGDTGRMFSLHVEDASFSFRTGTPYTNPVFEGRRISSNELFTADQFDSIVLKNVLLIKVGAESFIHCSNGNLVSLKGVRTGDNQTTQPFHMKKINNTIIDGIK